MRLTHFCCDFSPDLNNRNRVRRHSEISSTNERLSTSLHSLQVLAAVQTLVLDEVLEEVQQVTVVLVHGRLGDEAVDSHLAVGTNPDIPLGTTDVDGGDGLASGRDRARTTQGRKPDHDLVLLAAVRSRAEEQVVRNIRDDIGGGVAIPEMVRG